MSDRALSESSFSQVINAPIGATGNITGVDRMVTMEQPPDKARGAIGYQPGSRTAPPRPDDPPPSARRTIDKQQASGSGETLVTFRLPAEVQATTVSVVGQFNDWSTDAHRMRRDDEGFTAVIPLTPGRAYRFRYLLDGERWQNDWEPPTPTCPTSSVAPIPSSISPTCHPSVTA